MREPNRTAKIQMNQSTQSPSKAEAPAYSTRLTREEQLALKIGDVIWVSDHGNMKHCYEYEIKPLTQGRAVSGISLRDAKRKDYHVFRANAEGLPIRANY